MLRFEAKSTPSAILQKELERDKWDISYTGFSICRTQIYRLKFKARGTNIPSIVWRLLFPYLLLKQAALGQIPQ